jgi:uncharacterized protein YbjQ (UPF0145 family)
MTQGRYPGPPQMPQGYQQAMPSDLPQHARERLMQMRQKKLFTSDLSINEFLLVKQAGFEPLGLVMGSSVYQMMAQVPQVQYGQYGIEVSWMSHALYHSRELAMNRMEEEANELGADGIVGVRLEVNVHAFGQGILEFMAVGTAVRHADGVSFRNAHGKPFQSDLSGQDFWTLISAGYRPVGFVMGNCVSYVPPNTLMMTTGSSSDNQELSEYTHVLYDARELAIGRLQYEAESLHAEGIVGVTVTEKEHSWGAGQPGVGKRDGNAAYTNGELIELFVVGTAVVRYDQGKALPPVHLAVPLNK